METTLHSVRNKSKEIAFSRNKQYKCLVPECDTTHRYDNLKRHYRQNVDEESLLIGNIDNCVYNGQLHFFCNFFHGVVVFIDI